MVLIRCVVLFCLVYSGLAIQSDQKLLNNVADFMLKTLKIFNQPGVPVKDVKNRFPGGELEANRGILSDFHTIHRVGDVKLELKDGEEMLINFRISFDTLKLRFEEYKLKTLGQTISSGIVEAVVRENLLEFGIDLNQNSACFLKIKKLDVAKLNDIQLKFYGPGGEEVGWKSMIANPAVKIFENSLKSEAERILREELPSLMMPTDKPVQTSACVQVYSRSVFCEGTLNYNHCITKNL